MSGRTIQTMDRDFVMETLSLLILQLFLLFASLFVLFVRNKYISFDRISICCEIQRVYSWPATHTSNSYSVWATDPHVLQAMTCIISHILMCSGECKWRVQTPRFLFGDALQCYHKLEFVLFTVKKQILCNRHHRKRSLNKELSLYCILKSIVIHWFLFIVSFYYFSL